MYQRETIEIDLGGSKLLIETGAIARQANGAVVVRLGDTMVMATACCAKDPKEGVVDFCPLTVNYQEKFSAAGKTLSGFIKREGRPNEKETLISRLIDRPLRPLFPDGWGHETQVISTVWSYDGVNTPDVLGLNAASAALVISDIPLLKAVGAVRVGMVGEEFVINPSLSQQQESKLDLLIAGTEDAVLMIEGFCDFLTEQQVVEAIQKGHDAIAVICKGLSALQERVGKAKKTDTLYQLPDGLLEAVETAGGETLRSALAIEKKQEREEATGRAKEHVMAQLFPEGLEEPAYSKDEASVAFKKVQARFMRERVLEKGVRCDGRSPTDIRPIAIEPGYLPRTHGSAIFTRGETQAVAVCTLGGQNMAQRFEDINEASSRRFYLQYFFPPYSVGEVGRSGPAGRREIGHGKLAERAIQVALPSEKAFPYTIRLESNITESNGSSSMASVCGGCLALMDAGVPIERPVAGIALGLILEADRHLVLSDILGIEDALGDMDFKVTGDDRGITAFQMDIKVEGITPEIMRSALEQAKAGRVHILSEMKKALPQSRERLSSFAPRIEVMQIKPSKIAVVIGPGGKQIRAIIDETGVEINIEDDGLINLASSDEVSLNRAKEIIESLTAEVEIDKTYTGRVTSVTDFGAFVEILPGKEGLCHISELDHQRINKIREFVKEGDTITVKVLDITERGQIRLSRKALLVKT